MEEMVIEQMMLYLAMSMDGCLANEKGCVSWTVGDSRAPDPLGILDTVNAVVMGWTVSRRLVAGLSPEFWRPMRYSSIRLSAYPNRCRPERGENDSLSANTDNGKGRLNNRRDKTVCKTKPDLLSVLGGYFALVNIVETAELLQVIRSVDQHDLGKLSGADVLKSCCFSPVQILERITGLWISLS